MNQVALNSSFQEAEISVIGSSATTVAEVLAQLRRTHHLSISDLARAAGCSRKLIRRFRGNYHLLSPGAYDRLEMIEVSYALEPGALTKLVPTSVAHILQDLPQDLHGAFVAVVKKTGLFQSELATQLGMPLPQLRHWAKVGGFRSAESRRILSNLEKLAGLTPDVLTSRFDAYLEADRIEERLPTDFWSAVVVLCEASGHTATSIASATGLKDITVMSNWNGNTVPVRAQDFAEKLEALFLLCPKTLQMRLPTAEKILGPDDWQVRAPKIGQVLIFGQSVRVKAGKGPATIQTDISTLRRFLDYHGADDDTSVSPLLDAGFPDALNKFLLALKSGGAIDRSLSSTKARLEQWHRNARELLTVGDLPDGFHDALRMAIDRSGYSFDQLARLSGIRAWTIQDWSKGVYPSFKFTDRIPNLEAALGLHPGALMSKLGRIRNVAFGRKSIKPRMIQRHMLTQKRYALTKLPPRVEKQWQALFKLKTLVYLRPRPSSDPCVTDFSGRRYPGRWRLRKSQRYETADFILCDTRRFLGFLTLPSDASDPHLRGLGRTLESLSLADLVDLKNVSAFIEFRRGRSGGLGGDILKFVQFAKSLVHPAWGILRLRYDLFDSDNPATWKVFCDDAWEALSDFERDLRARKEIKKLRDPKVELAYILDLSRPIQKLVELESRLRADPPLPTASLKKQAVYWRNLLFICLLISTPLRESNFSYMTYRPANRDDPGHVHKRGDEWWLNIPSDQFKNDQVEPYIVRVPPRLWKLLDDYTTKWRPLLIGAETSDRLFLPSDLGRHPRALNDSTKVACLSEYSFFRIVTTRSRAYIAECPGFGPHATRHIIATDYLRTHPNGHIAVAAILHDKPETVLREYAHLRVADTYERYVDHYYEAFGESRST